MLLLSYIPSESPYKTSMRFPLSETTCTNAGAVRPYPFRCCAFAIPYLYDVSVLFVNLCNLKAVMLCHVALLGAYDKIAEFIISVVSIDMMNNLGREKFSAKMPFHKHAMFKFIANTKATDTIIPSVCPTTFFRAASPSPFPLIARTNAELPAALETDLDMAGSARLGVTRMGAICVRRRLTADWADVHRILLRSLCQCTLRLSSSRLTAACTGAVACWLGNVSVGFEQA